MTASRKETERRSSETKRRRYGHRDKKETREARETQAEQQAGGGVASYRSCACGLPGPCPSPARREPPRPRPPLHAAATQAPRPARLQPTRTVRPLRNAIRDTMEPRKERTCNFKDIRAQPAQADASAEGARRDENSQRCTASVAANRSNSSLSGSSVFGGSGSARMSVQRPKRTMTWSGTARKISRKSSIMRKT